MKNRHFFRIMLVVVLICLVPMVVRLVRAMGDYVREVDRELTDSFVQSIANSEGMSTEARQLAAVFHTSTQAALLDEDGHIVAQTREFLLLRGQTSVVALLPGLSEEQRAALRTAASKEETESAEQLARATAFRYEGYVYGDVVYQTGTQYAQDSVAVTVPLALTVKSTDAADVVSVEALAIDPAQEVDGALTSRAWLPYLREEPVDTSRLVALNDGATPRQSWLRWEHMATLDVPAELGASSLVVYRVTHPLLDTLRAEAGTMAIWLLGTLMLAATLALVLERMLYHRTAKYTDRRDNAHPDKLNQ